MQNWVFVLLAVVGCGLAAVAGTWMGRTALDRAQGPEDELRRRERAVEEAEHRHVEALRKENAALRKLEAALEEQVDGARRAAEGTDATRAAGTGTAPDTE